MDYQYTCVNCGSQVRELYKKYSKSVLKVMSCQQCHHIADKYIEYDPAIIIIDLILLNKQAYRHILFNTKFENHWKLAVILLLMETYSEWINTSSSWFISSELNTNLDYEHNKDLKFYFICMKVLSGTLTFVLTIFGLTKLKRHFCKEDSVTSLLVTWKLLTLSSFGRFLHLPALIWGDAKLDIHYFFVLGYTMLTYLLVHSVTMNCSRLCSSIIVFLAYALKIYVTNLFTSMVLYLMS